MHLHLFTDPASGRLFAVSTTQVMHARDASATKAVVPFDFGTFPGSAITREVLALAERNQELEATLLRRRADINVVKEAQARLAQRVQELEGENEELARRLDGLRVERDEQAGTILRLESALQREKVRIRERENALVLARETAAEISASVDRLEAERRERAQVERDLRATVDSLEQECGHRARLTKNLRQELAEKAEEIRILKSALSIANSASMTHVAAIQAGLAHVEKARMSARIGQFDVTQPLDLAREALTGGTYIPSCRSEAACREAGQEAVEGEFRALCGKIADACAEIRAALQRARQGKA